MKPVIAAAFALACALSLGAQITATLKRIPRSSEEIRIRNDFSVSLAAVVVSASLTKTSELATPPDRRQGPLIFYFDSTVDETATPIPPKQETVVGRGMNVPAKGGGSIAVTFEPPIITAGIFADGTTTGDPELLRRLILRRCNMLQAVETALDILSDAGKRNVPRDLLVNQFRKMADSMNRWYVPPEQRVGHDLYQSMMGKILNLPQEPVGSPFPSDAFVAEETAMLNRQRVELLESQPSLAEAAVIRR